MTHIKSLTNPNRKGIIPLSQVHPNHAMLVSEHFLSLIETSSDNPTAHQLADVLITQLLIPLPTHAEWPPKSTDPDNEPDPPNPFQDLVTNLIDAQLLAIRTHQVQYSTVTLDQAAAICHKHISQANGCLGNIPPGSAPYATLSRHSSNIELALGSLESHLPPNPHHSLPINYNLPNRPLRQRDRAAQDNNPLVQLDDHFDLEAVIAEHNNEHMVDDNNNNYLGGDNNDNDGQEDHQDDIPPQPSGFQAQIQPAGRPNHPIPDANVQPLEDLPPTNVIIHQGNDVQIERINAEAPMAQPIPLADNLPLDELSAHFAALGNAIMNADDVLGAVEVINAVEPPRIVDDAAVVDAPYGPIHNIPLEPPLAQPNSVPESPLTIEELEKSLKKEVSGRGSGSVSKQLAPSNMSPEHLHQVLHATAHLFRPGSTKHAVITTLASDHEAIKGVQTMESLFDKLPKRLVDDPLTRNVLLVLGSTKSLVPCRASANFEPVLDKSWRLITSFLQLPLNRSVRSAVFKNHSRTVPTICQLYFLHDSGIDIDAMIDYTQCHPHLSKLRSILKRATSPPLLA
jgi:hypothetical protein